MKIWIVLTLVAAASCSVVAAQGGFGSTAPENLPDISSR